MISWQPAQRMLELNVNDSPALAADTWADWRKGAFSDEALLNRIIDLEQRIKNSGAFLRECARWPEGNQNEDFSFLYDFALARMRAVDEYVAGLTDGSAADTVTDDAPVRDD